MVGQNFGLVDLGTDVIASSSESAMYQAVLQAKPSASGRLTRPREMPCVERMFVRLVDLTGAQRALNKLQMKMTVRLDSRRPDYSSLKSLKS